MRYFIYCRKSSEGEERQVLSLASQQEALAKSFGDNSEIEIVGVYEESKSAKTPGRPLFAEMLSRIEAGEADGIASWAPDRLARNSIDGGHIIYLLDRGVLRDLKFATYTFENNPQGKFMLGIMFNQSKYYSDALSENVKRGNATKVKMGWRPNRPPIGYLNCPQTRTIIPDPDLFPLVRRIFDLFLTGAYAPRQIGRIAQDEWGFLTPRKPRSGGKPLGRSTIYHMLANPFYMGILEWSGTSHQGKHVPMVTPQEFAHAQTLMRRGNTTRPKRYDFAFTGLLACGSCDHAISAEHKVNRHGSRYIYYHCAARSRISNACDERSVEEAELMKQFATFLASIGLRPGVAAWVRDRLRAEQARSVATANKIAVSLATTKAEISKQLKELTSLRLRRMVDDDEFVSERQRLEAEQQVLENAPDPASGERLFELLDSAERISNQAVEWFAKAPPANKQTMLKIVCSNPVLSSKKLSVEAAKPFIVRSDLGHGVHLRGVVDEVRMFTCEGKRLLASLHDLEAHGDVEITIGNLTELERLCLGPGPLPEAQRTQLLAVPSDRLRPAKSSRESPAHRRQQTNGDHHR